VLRQLVVKDLALIEDLSLEFGTGFNVVSGETGAGKSLLQRALAAAVGQRFGAESIRAGAAQASVAATFDLGDAAAARAALCDLGVAVERDVVEVTRAIPRTGRGRVSIEGTVANVGTLARLGEALVHLQGQHESLRLAEPGTQLAILDAAAGASEDAAVYARAWSALEECIERVESLERDAADRARRLELARHDLDELERAHLEGANEVERLGAERSRLRHAHRLIGAVEEALGRLDVGEHPALAAVEAAAARLGELGHLDPALGEVAAILDQAAVPLAEGVRALQRYSRTLETDPARLDAVEDRLALLARLVRKHACSDVAGLLARREALARLVKRGEQDEADPEALRRELARAADEAWHAATALSEKRRAGAVELVERVEAELAQLGMAEARFSVDFAELPAVPGGAARAELTRDGCGLGPDGLERIEFHLAANPGEGASPLARVASGGELSRIMLALRHVAGGSSVPTLVFDEVDAGIGGAAAETVGRRLHSLGRRHQVICITHLAQIAAFADHHYAVAKSRDGSRTRTSVQRVDGEDRARELARMLAGAEPGEEGLRYAHDMIRRARESVSLDASRARPPRRRAARGA
jgi:DNA repair protein RecN (Recombination protein N)